LKRKFTQLVQLNLLMLPMLIPILAVVCLYLFGSKTTTITEAVYVPLHGITTILPSPSLTGAADLAGLQMELPGFIPPWMSIVMIVCVLFLAITFGWQNAGAHYVLRGLFRGDAVFVFSDYFYAIKRNFKQAFFLGLIDFICSTVLVIDFIFFFFRTGSFGADFMYFSIFAIGLIYLIMRFYIYHLMVTFDLSIYKILKNALIFSMLGFKRNIMGVLGIVLITALHILLLLLLISTPLSGLPIILPFLWYMAAVTFTSAYAAYPVIDRYMIAPYINQTNEEEETAEEAVEE
jgi:uncharacterized membrane protein YesL